MVLAQDVAALMALHSALLVDLPVAQTPVSTLLGFCSTSGSSRCYRKPKQGIIELQFLLGLEFIGQKAFVSAHSAYNGSFSWRSLSAKSASEKKLSIVTFLPLF
ncbi:hypothetical protein PoB_003035000 [Plakobranchus ocellatus]|uniref:Uncharacterized protein n=1 Tax=Plakobranchus ocellatus TaxID=259542 RepID=A0AAV4A908_9GAST|nr:hypothetical protein PoB_003035000 [Plakobranchus ocellatus]